MISGKQPIPKDRTNERTEVRILLMLEQNLGQQRFV